MISFFRKIRNPPAGLPAEGLFTCRRHGRQEKWLMTFLVLFLLIHFLFFWLDPKERKDQG